MAIGRASVRQRRVLLFDGLLSNLDAALRVDMRIGLGRLHKELGSTVIFVTHDQLKAMAMGDRMALFNKHQVEQLDAPVDLHNTPAKPFGATFLGAPEFNLMARPAASGAAAPHQALWALGQKRVAGTVAAAARQAPARLGRIGRD